MADPSPHSRLALVAAAIGLAVGAVAHVVIFVGGPDWIAFSGAPEAVVYSARNGTWVAPVGTFIITGLLSILAVYCLSAAGLVRPMPFASVLLWLFAGIFVLRGLIVVPAIAAGNVNWSAALDLFIVTSSGFILLVGVLLLAGLTMKRDSIKANLKQALGDSNV